MRLFTKTCLTLGTLLICMAAVPAVKADPITIRSGGFFLTHLGNDGNGAPLMDTLVGAPTINTRDITGNRSYFVLLNPLTFATGFTGPTSGGSHPFNFTQLVTINGQAQVMELAGSIDIGHLVDTVHILSSAPLTFDFNTFSVMVSIIPTDIDGWGEGVFKGHLKARIDVITNGSPVPEPATLTLLGIGLAGAAAGLRRRRRAKNAEKLEQLTSQ